LRQNSIAPGTSPGEAIRVLILIVARHEDVTRVVEKGHTRATVLLRSGLQVELRVVPAANFGSALSYFTASKTHNIALRHIALSRGIWPVPRLQGIATDDMDQCHLDLAVLAYGRSIRGSHHHVR
jgi:hypothetical protein